MVPETVKMVWNAVIQSPSFDRVLNSVKLLSAGNGMCTAEMKVAEEHSNSNGTLHGGLTCTMIDIISGVALVTHKFNPDRGVSVDIHVSFMSPAPIGEIIFIEARTRKVGRILAFLDVEIKNKSNGKLVAFGTHTKFIG